jgi:glutamine cyclotransferase
MKYQVARVLTLGMAALAMSHGATAATFRVDDSLTQVLESTLPMRWQEFSPAASNHFIEGNTRVQVRLNLAPWQGKVGKIYMALPAQSIGAVQVNWRGQGKLLDGALLSGQRSLVYAGPITTALLDDVLTVHVRADGKLVRSLHRLEFHFDIDLD